MHFILVQRLFAVTVGPPQLGVFDGKVGKVLFTRNFRLENDSVAIGNRLVGTLCDYITKHVVCTFRRTFPYLSVIGYILANGIVKIYEYTQFPVVKRAIMHIADTVFGTPDELNVTANSVPRHVGRPVPTEVTLCLAHKQTFDVKHSVVPAGVDIVHHPARRQHFYSKQVAAFFDNIAYRVGVLQKHILGMSQIFTVEIYVGIGIDAVEFQ